MTWPSGIGVLSELGLLNMLQFIASKWETHGIEFVRCLLAGCEEFSHGCPVVVGD